MYVCVYMCMYLSDEESVDGGEGHAEVEEQEGFCRALEPRHGIEHRTEQQRVHTGQWKLPHIHTHTYIHTFIFSFKTDKESSSV